MQQAQKVSGLRGQLTGVARRARKRVTRRFSSPDQVVQQRERQARVIIERAHAATPVTRRLDPAQAVEENGFAVFRGLFSPEECAELGAEFKAEAGITEGRRFTRCDATMQFPATRRVLFNERLLDAVRSSLRAECRFLQAGDLHYLHDTAGWHRDSVHRLEDNSATADWSDRDGPYGVVKAILYLESDNAAMGFMGGSHLSPLEIDRDMVRTIERLGGELVVGPDDEPNRRYSNEEKGVPMAWAAKPGDVLVFDERMYHAGRRVEAGVEGWKVTTNRAAAKFCLSLTFGADNAHSQRYYSYFRYARKELGFLEFGPGFLAELEQRDLVLASGQANYYADHPEEVRLVHLRHPETMEELVTSFSAR